MSSVCIGVAQPRSQADVAGCDAALTGASEAAAVLCQCAAAISDDLPAPSSQLLAVAGGVLTLLALVLLATEGGDAGAGGVSALPYHPAGVVPTLQGLAKGSPQGSPMTKKQLHFGAGRPAAQPREMV